MEVTLEVFEGGKKSPKYNLISDINGEVSGEDYLRFLSASVASIARQVHREELDKGFDKKANVFTDNVLNKPMELVSPFGRIDIVARQDISQMIITVYASILKKSPILTGTYYDSNVVLWNGKTVANTMDGLKKWLDTKPTFEAKDKIQFINVQPYARKLERYAITRSSKPRKKKINKKKDRTYLVGSGDFFLPNGTYKLTQRVAERIFGKNAWIKFSFVDGGDFNGLDTHTYKKKSGREDRTGKPYFYPCITIGIIGAASVDGGRSL